MRLAILSCGSGWHARDLRRAAQALGQASTIVDFRRIQASLPPGASSLDDFDAVIVRTMPPGSLEQVIFRMDALHRCQATGRRVVNPPLALETCIDKYLACARLDAAGLPVPRTTVCQNADSAMEAHLALGGDVVVKPLFGSEGRGMIRVSDEETAWRAFRNLERLQAVLYLQEFIAHPGWDLRAFVIGGRVLAAMRRHSKNDWRTNIAQGGRAETVSLTAEEDCLALKAATAVGAAVAGVDLLPRPDGGYVVLEVNAVPGWRALAPTTGVDVATAIIQHVTHS
ncbi:MAG: RimK family alpha-L-glutamate ligase [Planctomycetes bacterium]|nr:RimK family alpha-L-glutamate ligase [Planctomycetota bacterium]